MQVEKNNGGVEVIRVCGGISMSDKTAPPQESLEETYLWFDSETRIKKQTTKYIVARWLNGLAARFNFIARRWQTTSTTSNADVGGLRCLSISKQKYFEALHRMKQESALLFNLKYFEEKILVGMSVKTTSMVLSKSIKINTSVRMLFEIGKEKYFEVLDR
ncbi:hypothetical protein P8452_16446 [Trifolium repens]|nr:hypothetical protein P8452_16446 [Trifolium repens]